MLIKRVFFLAKLTAFSYAIVFFLFPPVSGAQDYGFSGEIGLTYERDTTENEIVDSKLSNIEQRYTLNYSNFIYKPKLLTYYLSGSFIKNDGKANDSEAQAKSKEYKARLNFLNGTPYPFNLWASKQSPTSFTSQQNGQAVFFKQDIESFGFNGGLYLPRLPTVRYSFRQEDKKTTGQTQVVDERDRDFLLSVEQTWQNSRAQFKYEYESDINKMTSAKEDRHDYLLHGTTAKILSNSADMHASAEFHKNTFSEATDIKASTFFNYYPTNKFRGKASALYHHTIQFGENGDSFTTALNTVYKLSKVYTLTGDGSLNYSTGYFGERTSEDMGGTLNYTDMIAKNLMLSSTASLSFGARQGDPYDRETISTGLSSTLNKNIPSVRSSITAGAAAKYLTSSAGGKEEDFFFNLTASSQYIRRLIASSQLKYEYNNTEYDRTDSLPGDTVKTEKITSDTSLSYYMLFGWRARLDIRTGVLIEEGTSFDRESFYVDETLNYTILTNLLMRANSRYEYEGFTSTDTLRFDVELNYRIRSIFVTLKHAWRRDTQASLVTTTTHTFLEVVRPF
jgi:hypothetical protein